MIQRHTIVRIASGLLCLVLSAEVHAAGSEYQKRMDGLVPLDQFLPQAVRKRIERRKQSVQSLLQNGGEAASAPVIPAAPLVDLRSRDTAVKKQFGGTCTTFGLVAAMENLLGGGIDLSERHTWSKYQKYSAATAISTIKKSGVVEEKWWPQSNTRPYKGYKNEPWRRISAYQYFEDDIQRAVDALDRGKPLYFGVSTPQDMVSCKAVIRPKSGVTSGGHAFAVVGYRADESEPAGGYFLVKNSWGSGCGEKGYQWFPFSLCRRSDMYCLIWTIDDLETY